jgi:CRP/FNR family transcriptional regulator
MIVEFCESFGTKKGSEILIQVPLTREEMANYIGVTRETISRKLRVLEEDGVLHVKGKKITVKDYDELLAYAG